MHKHKDESVKSKKSNPVKLTLILLTACLILFLAGYAVAATGIDEAVTNAFKNFFGIEHTVTPPDNDEPDEPGEPGETPTEPDEPGEPDENPQEPGDSEDPPDPVIYVGQVLIIPISGEGEGGDEPSLSQVVSSGTVPLDKKHIALTFDSGWLFEQTIPLLNVLDNYGVKATFFPRALWIEDHPELGREIAGRGHTMGNHSLTHRQFTKLTLDEVRREMRESTRIIEEVTGIRPYLFRPPYGEYYNQDILRIFAEEGYPYTVMWTIDTHDWADEMHGQQVTVDYIVNRVLNNASDRGIVLMHIGGPKTVEALPRIIEGLRNMGYHFATLDKMLPRPGSGLVSYTVKSGDTLYSIARHYGITVQQLIDVNDDLR